MYPNNQPEAREALRGADTTLAATAEAMLWGIWCRSGDPMIDQLLREGIDSMQQHRLAEAEALFARIIAAAPEFAEGWNKRATVRYLRKDFLAAVADCQETLARNPLTSEPLPDKVSATSPCASFAKPRCVFEKLSRFTRTWTPRATISPSRSRRAAAAATCIDPPAREPAATGFVALTFAESNGSHDGILFRAGAMDDMRRAVTCLRVLAPDRSCFKRTALLRR